MPIEYTPANITPSVNIPDATKPPKKDDAPVKKKPTGKPGETMPGQSDKANDPIRGTERGKYGMDDVEHDANTGDIER